MIIKIKFLHFIDLINLPHLLLQSAFFVFYAIFSIWKRYFTSRLSKFIDSFHKNDFISQFFELEMKSPKSNSLPFFLKLSNIIISLLKWNNNINKKYILICFSILNIELISIPTSKYFPYLKLIQNKNDKNYNNINDNAVDIKMLIILILLWM